MNPILLTLAEMIANLVILRADHVASPPGEWEQLREYASIPSSEYGMLLSVNDRINRKSSWRSDLDVWRVEDYWASPKEFLEKRKGDCEDFAIAKYFLLLDIGVKPELLRLVHVQIRGEAHMVLAYGEEDPYILDSYPGRHWVQRLSKRPDLTEPVFFRLPGESE